MKLVQVFFYIAPDYKQPKMYHETFKLQLFTKAFFNTLFTNQIVSEQMKSFKLETEFDKQTNKCVFSFYAGSMEGITTFLEQPIDRDLYKLRHFMSQQKKPLRVLVTDAGGKIAYNLIYQICCGNVFGSDQEVILHLISSRGSIHHKAIVLELSECGFSVFKDFVVSSNPVIAYKKVDVVIAIATYEEMPGRMVSASLVYQMIKARQVAKYVQDFASKDAKIIFTGPSTKALTVLLGSFRKFAPKIPPQNVSGVTHLDVIISKAILAAKLKTTTDKIKNVIIWSATFADVYNATVRTFPPNDLGAFEMKDIPVSVALNDEEWLYTNFGLSIYRRIMSPDLLKYGKALALGTVHHLKILLQSSNKFEEIPSMAVITPPSNPYGVPSGYGFSFPVITKCGTWEIIEGIRFDVPTHLNMLRAIFNLTHGIMLNSIMKVVSFMLDYEAAKNQMVSFSSKSFMDEVIETRHWTTKYFVTPIPAEGIAKPIKNPIRTSRKSIVWNDELSQSKKKLTSIKSFIRFSSDDMNTNGKESKSDTKRDVRLSW